MAKRSLLATPSAVGRATGSESAGDRGTDVQRNKGKPPGDGHGRGATGTTHAGHARLGDEVRAELPTVIPTPAISRPVHGYPAGVIVPQTHRLEGEPARDGRGRDSGGARTIAKLPIGVTTPAVRSAACGNAARANLRGRHRGEGEPAFDGCASGGGSLEPPSWPQWLQPQQ